MLSQDTMTERPREKDRDHDRGTERDRHRAETRRRPGERRRWVRGSLRAALLTGTRAWGEGRNCPGGAGLRLAGMVTTGAEAGRLA